MGQDYNAIVIKGENVKVIDSMEYGLASKITEFAYLGNDFMNAVAKEIFGTPAKVAFIGDYSSAYEYEDDEYEDDEYEDDEYEDDEEEDDEEEWYGGMSREEYEKYYQLAWPTKREDPEDHWTYLTWKEQHIEANIEAIGEPFFTTEFKGYLVNHDLKLYLDMEKYISKCEFDEGWCMNPLALLTACGNGEGCGDYDDHPDVGLWAFNTLEITTEIPDGYSEFTTEFYEP